MKTISEMNQESGYTDDEVNEMIIKGLSRGGIVIHDDIFIFCDYSTLLETTEKRWNFD